MDRPMTDPRAIMDRAAICPACNGKTTIGSRTIAIDSEGHVVASVKETDLEPLPCWRCDGKGVIEDA
jgi:RecJ-like exonuclease